MSFFFRKSFSLFVLSLFKEIFSDLDRLWRVLTGQENVFFLQKVFSLSVHSLFKEMFSWPRKALRGVDGSRKYLFTFIKSKSFLFSSTVYSRRCFLWPRNGKSTTVNNYQWSRHRLQTERTRLKLSFEWPISHHGGKYLSQKMLISRLWDCLI